MSDSTNELAVIAGLTKTPETAGLDDLMNACTETEKHRRKYMLAFDATGSMGSLWETATVAVKATARIIEEKSQCPVVFKIVAYRDADFDDIPLETSEWTESPTYIESFIKSVCCSGGGDGPEHPELAIQAANNEHANCLIIIGDAPGKDLTKAIKDATDIKERGDKIFTLAMDGNYAAQFFEAVAKAGGGKNIQFDNLSNLEDIINTIMSLDAALQIAYQPRSLEARRLLEEVQK